MTLTPSKGADGRRILGLGALACIGCCAGPLLALLGGVSLAGLAATTVVGGAGLVVAGGAAVAYLSARRRRRACAVTEAHTVPIAAPTWRTSADTEEVPVP